MLKYLILVCLLVVSLESAPMTPMGFPMLEDGFFNSKSLFGYIGKFKVKTPGFEDETTESNEEFTTTKPEEINTFPNWYLNPLTHHLRPLSRVFLGRRSN